jgi:2'-5' RNA ligase
VRLFLAINLPPDVRAALHAATGPLRAAAPAVKWVGPEQLHLTLKFLGEQADDTAARVRETLPAVTARHAGVPLALGGVGAFPNFRRARIVWMGVGPSPRLELLYHDVEAACAAIGLEVEGRAFRPHITLGRIGDRVDDAARRALARAAREVDYEVEVDVESVDLMQSETAAGGARYTALARAPLRSA